ncbi:hypothetical protein [Mahella australiensis]|uniref:Uncharacterized protein n=1 Tax=Mahella australiensis (strain DSM 15567 / CIP 107919 / 50-1 BON) TaxID=697281 RepID=F3ZZF4_MAHA5|nr:hypothetical protein [Mahella australiensis]AEE95764.1 hypothetical protein Mahau_0560 [Mahella australiensis 50-1 BON]
MTYRVSGIANVVVEANDKREAIAKAREEKPSVVWVEADEIKDGGDNNDD